jgi:hypothetical protein
MNRLGRNGPEEIMSHPWFSDLDFNKLIKKQLTAGYIPECKSEDEI